MAFEYEVVAMTLGGSGYVTALEDRRTDGLGLINVDLPTLQAMQGQVYASYGDMEAAFRAAFEYTALCSESIAFPGAVWEPARPLPLHASTGGAMPFPQPLAPFLDPDPQVWLDSEHSINAPTTNSNQLIESINIFAEELLYRTPPVVVPAAAPGERLIGVAAIFKAFPPLDLYVEDLGLGPVDDLDYLSCPIIFARMYFVEEVDPGEGAYPEVPTYGGYEPPGEATFLRASRVTATMNGNMPGLVEALSKLVDKALASDQNPQLLIDCNHNQLINLAASIEDNAPARSP